ncbi:MAG TPA: TrmO family methyltransferase [Anaerolineales bacterium]|nr:TrmO family methyltransferase [Anaerolineales bacterium]
MIPLPQERSPAITYQPIGVVSSPLVGTAPPEDMRGHLSDLVLHDYFSPAVAELAVGDHLWVIYHLHRLESWDERLLPRLFTWRTPSRPNPLGITLTRVIATSGSTITVIGLDAIDGSPILDIKPYKSIFDQPPVEPQGDSS